MKHRTPATGQHASTRPSLALTKRQPNTEIDAAPERLIRRPEVLRLTGLSRTSMYRLIEKQDFPRPVSLSAKTVAWPASQVNAWIAARVATTLTRKGS